MVKSPMLRYLSLLLVAGCAPAQEVPLVVLERHVRQLDRVPITPPAAPVRIVAVRAPAEVTVPEGPCSAEMVLAGKVCIDRWEAHLREGAVVHPHFERPSAGTKYVAASAPDVLPQAYISRVEALAACSAAGKRLCSRAEWMRACRGTPAASCNRAKPHLLSVLFPDRNGSYDYERHFNSPELAKVPGFLSRTAEHARCVSEVGAHDMVGNVHEWVSDTVSRKFIDAFEQEMPRQWQPSTPGNGIFMGGFFSTQNEHGQGCTFTTIAHEPTYHDYSTGFRCCAAPKG